MQNNWIKDLNVKLDNIKLLVDNIGRMLFDIIPSNFFFYLFPKVKEIKVNINKWDLTKFKSFCTGKETTAMKRQH